MFVHRFSIVISDYLALNFDLVILCKYCLIALYLIQLFTYVLAHTHSGVGGGVTTPRLKFCRQITNFAISVGKFFNLLYSRNPRGSIRSCGVT